MAGLIQKIGYRCDSSSDHSHFHNAYEMIYIASGEASLRINETVYPVKKHSVAFISNLEEHSTQITAEPYARYFMILDSRLADQLLDQPELLAMFKNRPKNFCHCFDAAEAASLVEPLFASLVRLREQQMEFKEQLESAILTQMLIYLYNSSQYHPVSPSPHPEVFAVQKYIDEHFTQDLRIADIASEFYVDHCHLTHLFKQVTGYSPKQYMMLNRLSYARRLLIQTGDSVSEIADISGFGDVNNFIRYFKREYGITPKQYRSQRKR